MGLHRFRDLNVTCPKENFPLPITLVIINDTCSFERISFIDDFSRYNQIKMYLDNEKNTSFLIPQGVFYYIVMPFSLKNARATYQ